MSPRSEDSTEPAVPARDGAVVEVSPDGEAGNLTGDAANVSGAADSAAVGVAADASALGAAERADQAHLSAHKKSSPWRDGMGMLATRSMQTLAILAIIVLLVLLGRSLSLVVIPIMIALILAAALSPVIRVLRGWKFPPALAAVTALLSAGIVIGGVLTLIVNAVRNQWSELADSAIEGFHELQDLFEGMPIEVTPEQLESFKQTVIKFLTSSSFGSSAVAGISATGTFLTGMVLMFVVLFFFLKDGRQIWEFLLRPFHGAAYERGVRVGDKAVSVLGHYIRGTATVAAVDALGIYIGLILIGVPLALPLAFLVFLLSFIPLVGATVAGTLAALVALVSNGPLEALFVIGVVVLVNQLEGNFLQPVVMGRSLSLHPLVILLALTAGTITAGILGAVLSVPLAALVWGIMLVWDGPNLPAKFIRQKSGAKAVAAN
ncbi:AI-2E family transporter [Jonesiaceae bacterium BS-20]|uniref:AI-2E family transporter n=1 Tax=Jonesiaceae bacterium BS-20 TaxID=3120821 RepID=A0AAU7DWL8_9MICO